MQPQDVQTHFQDLKQAPQLFGMKMKLNYGARMEKKIIDS